MNVFANMLETKAAAVSSEKEAPLPTVYPILRWGLETLCIIRRTWNLHFKTRRSETIEWEVDSYTDIPTNQSHWRSILTAEYSFKRVIRFIGVMSSLSRTRRLILRQIYFSKINLKKEFMDNTKTLIPYTLVISLHRVHQQIILKIYHSIYT